MYDAKKKRDPFAPLISGSRVEVSGLFGVESIADIRLEGLVFDPITGSIVVANGVVLGEGETRDGVKVVEIKKDGVFFLIKEQVEFKPWGIETE